MANNQKPCCEKFKTMIGGQALIEGIMMRGPEKDAIVIRGKDGLTVEVTPRKVNPPGSFKSWPFLRGMFNFFDAQVVGVKALMRSADLAPEEYAEEPGKLDLWLEEKLGNEKFQKFLVGFAVALGMAMSIGLFFLLPTLLGTAVTFVTDSMLVRNVAESLLKIVIFVAYLAFCSRMKDMRRVFSYHGAEHKTIFCYEAGLPLTVENVRKQPCHHPRCGTSFLFVVIFVSIMVSTVVFSIWPVHNALLRFVAHLIMLPAIVGISFEFNRYVGRHDGPITRILTAPGLWMQNFTTFEPDDSMIEVGIKALELVLPEEEGADAW